MEEIQIISFNKELGRYLTQGDFITAINWIKEKPDFKENCILLTAVKIRGQWEYSSYLIELLEDQSSDDYYWGWLDMDGRQLGDIDDLGAELYFVIPMLKSAEQ